MRKLKFRARCAVAGKIQEELYNGQCFAWVNHERQNNIIIEQFTGIQDSKGADIYENDLVNISGSGLCRVEIQPYCGVVYIEVNEAMCGTDAHDVAMEKEDIFVVGNIHENEDLIETNK